MILQAKSMAANGCGIQRCQRFHRLIGNVDVAKFDPQVKAKIQKHFLSLCLYV